MILTRSTCTWWKMENICEIVETYSKTFQNKQDEIKDGKAKGVPTNYFLPKEP